MSFEVILIDEFARRLKISRATIFEWKKKGVLVPGRHYFQRGKVLRFFWDRGVVAELDNSPQPGANPMPATDPQSITGKNLDIGKPGINWDY